MDFWIDTLMRDLLIPAIMIGIGSYFTKRAPKKINSFFGYRTAMSMKNQDTWQFAHHHCGRLWRRIGWPMLACSVIAILFSIGKSAAYREIFGAVLCGAQTLVLIASIFPTELALKKTFDRDGLRRK